MVEADAFCSVASKRVELDRHRHQEEVRLHDQQLRPEDRGPTLEAARSPETQKLQSKMPNRLCISIWLLISRGWRPRLRLNLTSTIVLLFLLLFLAIFVPPAEGLRCYVCGGVTGRPCEEIEPRRWSPYVRPRPVLASDGSKQWADCNDLINNKGCIKQVVNDGT